MSNGSNSYNNSVALEGAISEVLSFPLFKGLSPDQIRNLIGTGTIHIQKHRDILFHGGSQATHFGIVLSGAYKLSRVTHLGDDAVIHFSSRGDVLAALVMAQENPAYPLTARAMGPSRALMIPRHTYVESWLATPGLVASIQGLLSSRMGRFQSQRVMQRAPLTSKIAALLLQLVSKNEDQEQMVISLPLTRKEIADTLGVAVESVIRIMSDWDKNGIINTTDQEIRLLQPERIIQEMES